jgi:hypothetical protein
MFLLNLTGSMLLIRVKTVFRESLKKQRQSVRTPGLPGTALRKALRPWGEDSGNTGRCAGSGMENWGVTGVHHYREKEFRGSLSRLQPEGVDHGKPVFQIAHDHHVR